MRSCAVPYGNLFILHIFNGKEITYDEVGNPLSYCGEELVWESGRDLAGVHREGMEASYRYNYRGVRTEKTVDGKTTKYRLNGDTILSESSGEETLYYYYDGEGQLAEIGYEKGDSGQRYYVVSRNGQGDITGLYEASGMKKIGSYRYGAWGNPLGVTAGAEASEYDPGDVLHKQPFRYRGYYYDRETGYYYLQNRYYNPQARRFLNADTILAETEDGLGYNLFAYCLNDPVNQKDPGGRLTDMEMVLISVGIVAALAAAAALLAATAPAAAAAVCVVKGAAVGAASGAVQGAASGAVSGAVAQVVSTGSFDGVGQAMVDGAASGMLSGTISGAISGALGGMFCFTAGTMVLTAEGEKRIEELEPGDLVWSYEPAGGRQELKEVVQTYENETEEVVHIHAGGKEITATPHHPFYSPVKGWTDAVELRAGDLLLRSSGEYVIVEQVQHEILESPEKVYNLEVEEYHTYYADGVVVHNIGGCGGQKEAVKVNERSNNPPARRIKSKSKKNAYEAAKRAGKGKEPIHHPNSPGQAPHYHPNVKEVQRVTPKGACKHDHYYYPR